MEPLHASFHFFLGAGDDDWDDGISRPENLQSETSKNSDSILQGTCQINGQSSKAFVRKESMEHGLHTSKAFGTFCLSISFNKRKSNR